MGRLCWDFRSRFRRFLVSAGLCCLRRQLGTLSPHPKIPFLADSGVRLCRIEARPRRAMVEDSVQAFRTAETIPQGGRAATRC